ncbi:hypothetical protein DUI87_08395 [Hirundo rustica rustica]|uniref:Uncharacterized protein n=1 Tax=Hirundo rustica rustica TaxID=333673 RepID=A0A3M0KU21_HIRRU|nr:hypothetical protein DUI87_08395 [Hirundo rustica rustica]
MSQKDRGRELGKDPGSGEKQQREKVTHMRKEKRDKDKSGDSGQEWAWLCWCDGMGQHGQAGHRLRARSCFGILPAPDRFNYHSAGISSEERGIFEANSLNLIHGQNLLTTLSCD